MVKVTQQLNFLQHRQAMRLGNPSIPLPPVSFTTATLCVPLRRTSASRNRMWKNWNDQPAAPQDCCSRSLTLQWSPKTLSRPHQQELLAISGHNARATRCRCFFFFFFFVQLYFSEAAFLFFQTMFSFSSSWPTDRHRRVARHHSSGRDSKKRGEHGTRVYAEHRRDSGGQHRCFGSREFRRLAWDGGWREYAWRHCSGSGQTRLGRFRKGPHHLVLDNCQDHVFHSQQTGRQLSLHYW